MSSNWLLKYVALITRHADDGGGCGGGGGGGVVVVIQVSVREGHLRSHPQVYL